MKLSDIARMAFLNLWSRKRRTILNLAGIVTGCTMLMMTFAGTRGVADGIHAIIDQTEGVRRIGFYAGWEPDSEPPEEVLEVHGEMSEERRERIQQILRDQWLWEHGTYSELERDDYEAVADWDHVIEVIAGSSILCRYELSDGSTVVERLSEDAREGRCDTASLVDMATGERIVAGRRLAPDDHDGVLVSEIGAYFLGFQDDAELKNIVGKTLRVEFSTFSERVSILTRILNSDFELGNIFENTELLLALKQLMNSLDETDLSDEQKELIRNALTGDAIPQSDDEVTNKEEGDEQSDDLIKIKVLEFTVKGVVRSGGDDGLLSFLNQVMRDEGPELLLHPEIIASLRDEYPDEYGAISHASGLVDHVENLEAVESKLSEKGFESYSAGWIIDRVDRQIRNAKIAISLLALLILLITAISLTNTMIIAVMERTPEFGIMKALGARNGHLLTLMLCEGAITGVIGAMVSVAVSSGLANLIDGFVRSYVERRMGYPFDATIFHFSSTDILLVLGVAFLVCTLAGIIPAFRAARLDPVVAMQRK
ncbi:MAG: ABC transporter permease [Planctomycetota bacterium]